MIASSPQASASGTGVSGATVRHDATALAFLDPQRNLIAADRTMLEWCSHAKAQSCLQAVLQDAAPSMHDTNDTHLQQLNVDWTLRGGEGLRRIRTRFVPVLDRHRQAHGLIAQSRELDPTAPPADASREFNPPRPELMWMVDGGGRGLSYDADYFNYVGLRDDADWRDALHGEDREQVDTQWRGAQSQDERLRIASRWRRRDGRYRRHLLNFTRAHGIDAMPSLWFASSVDVDVATQAHRTLDATRMYLSDFIAALGHDVRNPLAAMSAALRLLEHPGVTGDMALRARQTIDRKCQDLTRIADTLSVMSRSVRNEMQLKREPVEVQPLLRSAAADVAAHARACKVALVENFDETPLHLYLDPPRLRDALRALLLGAIEALPGGASVELGLRREASNTIVSCGDSAMAIAGAFVQLRPGNGVAPLMPQTLLHLGLSNFLRIVEMHEAAVALVETTEPASTAIELRFPYV